MRAVSENRHAEHQIMVTASGNDLYVSCTCLGGVTYSRTAGSRRAFIETRRRFRSDGGTAEVIVIWRNWHSARGVAV